MVGIGVIGLGFMGAMHLRALEKVNGAKLVAICNPSGRRLDGDFTGVAGNIAGASPMQLDMSVIRGYKDFDEMLANPDVHVVDICAPTPSHEDLAIAALKAGKHVICEKPLARHAETARRIQAAAESASGFFLPAMCLRFWPEWAYAKQLTDSETYGKLLAARFRRVAEPPGWGHSKYFDGAASGGGLFDLHIHDTDVVQWLFGRPKAVFSQGYAKVSGAVDHVVTQYVTDSGATVSAEGSWAMTPGFGFTMAYTLQFERATLDYDFSRTDGPLKLVVDDGSTHTLSFGGNDGYIGELQYVTDCVAQGKAPETVTVADAVQAVEICEAEERSVASGELETL